MGSLDDLDFDELAAWPLWKQILTVLLLFTVVQLFIAWMYLYPQLSQLQNLKQQQVRLQTQIRIKTQESAELPSINSSVNQLKNRYEGLLKQLPTAKQLTSALASINNIGLQNQLAFSRLDWASSQPHLFLNQLPLDMAFTGSYFDVDQFIESIHDLPFLIHLSEVTWQRVSQHSHQLRLEVRAYTYQLKEEELNAI